MSTGTETNKKTVGITKLPKGEFPSNIHILKGSSQENTVNIRGKGASMKGGIKKTGKLFHDMTLETLPKFKDVPSNHRTELFKAKLLAS